MKSVLMVMCEHAVTVGSKPSNDLKQNEGVRRSRADSTRGWASAPSMFFLLLFAQVFSVAPKYREKYLKGLEDPFGKWPAQARSPRECIGFAFYRNLKWDNPERIICLFVFIYKPLQKK